MTNELISRNFKVIKKQWDLHHKDKNCECRISDDYGSTIYHKECVYKALPFTYRTMIDVTAERWDNSIKHCNALSCCNNDQLKRWNYDGLYYCVNHHKEQVKLGIL